MLLLYRIYAILSSISGIDYFFEYDGLHKYQTYGTFQTSRTFQTTQPPVFSPSSLYSSARKLTIGAYIPPAKSWWLKEAALRPIFCSGKVDGGFQQQHTYIIYIVYSRRSVPNQFSPKASEGTAKQKYDKPHNRVVLGRNMKHPAACKRAYKAS